MWSEVSALTFTEVSSSSSADISINFGTGNHGDPYPFDGNGKLLSNNYTETQKKHIVKNVIFNLMSADHGTAVSQFKVSMCFGG